MRQAIRVGTTELGASVHRLGRIQLVAALVFVITAIFSTGFHHWDEHFQVLEFAGWKLGLSPVQDLPWEFAARIRPAIQPFIVVQVHHFMGLFGSVDPFVITFVLRAISAALWYMATILMLQAFMPSVHDPRSRKWFALLSFFLWFSVYNAVRFSSENWSGSLFMIGLALVIRKEQRNGLGPYLTAGLLFGLAFTFRMQTALMTGGLFAWLLIIQREPWRKLVAMAGGTLITVALGICIDRWFYGEWTLTVLNYFDANMLQGKAAAFGTQPWYAYFVDTVMVTLPPFSLIFVLAPLILVLFKPKSVLVWVFAPFLLVHCMIGHKELRFLFPIVGSLPIMIIIAMDIVRTKWLPGLTGSRIFNGTVKLLWVANLVLLGVVMFKPADAQIGLYKTIYDNYPDPITMYNFGEDPYHRVEQINFYSRPGLEHGGTITDNTRITSERPILIATMNPSDVLDRWPEHELVFASLPAWVKHFNFNGWLERTDQWYVYEVNN